MFREREGVVELLEDQLHHALKLALLLRGQMVEFSAHGQTSVAKTDSARTFVLTLFVQRHVCRAVAKIGRASCRESVCQYVEISVVYVTLKNKQTHNNR